MIHIINSNKLSARKINMAAIIKQSRFPGNSVNVRWLSDELKDQSVCPAETDLNQRKWEKRLPVEAEYTSHMVWLMSTSELFTSLKLEKIRLSI